MLRKLVVLAAWITLGLIVFVTLSPIGLRPETGSVELERFGAYGLLGALFVFGYPHHFTRVMTLILAMAIGLELLQHITPDRHGHLADAVEKLVGGFAGGSFARLAQNLRPKHTIKPS
ncbi:VanZ family protein [Bradyrhizobium sp. GM24.11]